MITQIQKHQQKFLIAILVVVIIAFTWLYNPTQLDQLNANNRAIIYGKTLTLSDLQREARVYSLARELQMFDFVSTLMGGIYSQQPTVESLIWNLLVLRHEAKALQIEPTSGEIAKAIRALPPFQTNGAFDPKKLEQFKAEALASRGFSPAQLDDLMRDNLRLAKIKALLQATSGMSPAEIRKAYISVNQRTAVQAVYLQKATFEKNISVTEEQISKYYEEHKNELLSEEQRVLRYVVFSLPEEASKMEGQQQIQELQKVADRASEFTQKVLDEGQNFDKLAVNYKLEVQETPLFTAAALDPTLGKLDNFSKIAFSLTLDDPDSDVIQHEDTFYVLHLEKLVPKEILPLEKTREKIVQTLKDQLASEQLQLESAKLKKAFEERLADGTSFADAATQLGYQAVDLPIFSQSDHPEELANYFEIARAVSDIPVTSMSEFVTTPEGGLFAYVKQRDPLDEAAFEKEKKTFGENLVQFKNRALVREWFRERQKAANLEIL